MYACAFACTCTCVCVYIYIYICVCVCVCVCVSKTGFRNFSPFCISPEKQSNDVFSDVAAHDLTYSLEVKDWNLDNFKIKHDYLVNGDRANITTTYT